MESSKTIPSFDYLIKDCVISSQHAIIAVLPAKNGTKQPDSYTDLLFILKEYTEKDIKTIMDLSQKALIHSIKINPIFIEYKRFKELNPANSLYYKNIIQHRGVVLYDNIQTTSL